MTEPYRQFYEDKALEYPELDRTAFVRYEKAVALAGLEAGHRVLDIACKDGVLPRLLAERGPQARYTGVDISSRVIEQNRRLGLLGEYVQGDICEGTELSAEQFDRVFALEIMEHLPEPPKLLREVRRLLQPDGRLILSVPNPYYYMEVVNELRHFPDTEGHLYSFTDANMRVLLQREGFTVEDTAGTYFLVPRRLRGAFKNHDFFILRRIPEILACSRIYRCKKS